MVALLWHYKQGSHTTRIHISLIFYFLIWCYNGALRFWAPLHPKVWELVNAVLINWSTHQNRKSCRSLSMHPGVHPITTLSGLSGKISPLPSHPSKEIKVLLLILSTYWRCATNGLYDVPPVRVGSWRVDDDLHGIPRLVCVSVATTSSCTAIMACCLVIHHLLHNL